MPNRSKNDSFEGIRERVSRAAWRQFDPEGLDGNDHADVFVLHTFDDAVIIQDHVSDKMFEVPYNRTTRGVMFGAPVEVEEMYVQKRFESAGLEFTVKGKPTELTGPIVMKNAPQRIAYAAVLVPGEPDSDGEFVTKEKIESAAHEWMAAYRNVDYQHRLNNVGVPVESYILPNSMSVKMDIGNGEEDVELPEGTWILASKFGEQTWNQIENGELTGYSVMGVRRTALDAAIKSAEALDEAAVKRTLLRDLGDWVPTHVSVVDVPAVPKAKFFALKSKKIPQLNEGGVTPQASNEALKSHEDIVTPEKATSIWKSLKSIFTSTDNEQAEKAGRSISEANLAKLQQAFEALQEVLSVAENERSNKNKEVDEEMKPEELQQAIEQAVKSAVEPLTQRIDELESSVKEKKEEVTEPLEAVKEAEGAVSSDALESFKSEVVDRLEKIEKAQSRNVAPKSLAGQDGDGAQNDDQAYKSAFGDRDAYGRKIRD